MNAESQPNLYAVYENCDPDYLRQLREAAGMDETTLARIACLSLAQVRQLQAGSGDGLFYSPTIKRQAYKRLLMILGAEPPQSIPEQNLAATEPVPAHEDMLHKLDQIVAMSTQTESIQTGQFALADFTHGVTSFLGERRQLVGSLALLLVAVGALLWSPLQTSAVSEQLAKLDVPKIVAPVAPVVADVASQAAVEKIPVNQSAQASAIVPAGLSETELSAAEKKTTPASNNCAFINDKLESLTAKSPSKAANYVHVVAETPTDVCVVDGNKTATLLHLKAGEGRSVYGGAPWQLSAENLRNTQIFFQGWRINVPAQSSQRVLLVETRW